MEKGKFEKLGYDLFLQIPNYYKKHLDASCATISQISCLMGLITNYKFSDGTPINNVIEIGVSIGLSSLYMLKAGSTNQKFTLYGIDKNVNNIGKCVYMEASGEEKKHWRFYPGTTTFNIESIVLENNISKDNPFDMLFIDGAHAHPYPLLDMIFLIPFCRNDALYILHDVEIYPLCGEQGNSYIYTAYTGNKYINWNIANPSMTPKNTEYMAILESDKQNLGEMLIRLAKTPIDSPYFSYAHPKLISVGKYLGLSVYDIEFELKNFMSRYYSRDFTSAFIQALVTNMKNYEQNEIQLHHQTRMMNTLWNRIKDLEAKVMLLSSKQQ